MSNRTEDAVLLDKNLALDALEGALLGACFGALLARLLGPCYGAQWVARLSFNHPFWTFFIAPD
jgi:hypothetical protein